ncbi:titin homolog [Eriocheir sinensis]|uniref:titin homolog n=1 Tax=Eriocheir sinensis TaxID=95602 RepID=UPI0021C791BB|nr:titin homolog [Eriocheir sinensis]XP_050690074.1 titin homolog [Eriocheir sinensis]
MRYSKHKTTPKRTGGALGFKTGIRNRKQLRKQKREMKKMNRASFAARRRGDNKDPGDTEISKIMKLGGLMEAGKARKTNITPGKSDIEQPESKIRKLQALMEAEKAKMKSEKDQTRSKIRKLQAMVAAEKVKMRIKKSDSAAEKSDSWESEKDSDVEQPQMRIKRLQELVEAEKAKMKAKKMNKSPEKSDTEQRRGVEKVKTRVKKTEKAEEKSDSWESEKEEEEEQDGFKPSEASKSERMARLQEFVNRESGIGASTSNSKPPGIAEEETEEAANLIKDKQKLKRLRNEQKLDTKEINKLARLMRMSKPQKKKVAPIFADDFGGLLRDIEEGTMSHADGYKNDEGDEKGEDGSDEEFERDMAAALGQKTVKKKKKMKTEEGNEDKGKKKVDIEEEEEEEKVTIEEEKENKGKKKVDIEEEEEEKEKKSEEKVKKKKKVTIQENEEDKRKKKKVKMQEKDDKGKKKMKKMTAGNFDPENEFRASDFNLQHTENVSEDEDGEYEDYEYEEEGDMFVDDCEEGKSSIAPKKENGSEDEEGDESKFSSDDDDVFNDSKFSDDDGEDEGEKRKKEKPRITPKQKKDDGVEGKFSSDDDGGEEEEDVLNNGRFSEEGEEEEEDGYNISKFSDDDAEEEEEEEEEDVDGYYDLEAEDEDEKDEGELDEEEEDGNDKAINSEPEDDDGNDTGSAEEENEGGFFDLEAMEDSEADEESDDDGELVHDIRKEEEYAFEGGSGYSKPEILKNGMENDIDRYSSNSDDDEDLEGFVIDDGTVEYDDDASDELPDELSDSPTPEKRKKRRRIVMETDEEGEEKEDGGESDDEGEDGDDKEFFFSARGWKNKHQEKISKRNETVCIETTSDEDSGDEADKTMRGMKLKTKGKKPNAKKRKLVIESESSPEKQQEEEGNDAKMRVKKMKIDDEGDDDAEASEKRAMGDEDGTESPVIVSVVDLMKKEYEDDADISTTDSVDVLTLLKAKMKKKKMVKKDPNDDSDATMDGILEIIAKRKMKGKKMTGDEDGVSEATETKKEEKTDDDAETKPQKKMVRELDDATGDSMMDDDASQTSTIKKKKKKAKKMSVNDDDESTVNSEDLPPAKTKKTKKKKGVEDGVIDDTSTVDSEEVTITKNKKKKKKEEDKNSASVLTMEDDDSSPVEEKKKKAEKRKLEKEDSEENSPGDDDGVRQVKKKKKMEEENNEDDSLEDNDGGEQMKTKKKKKKTEDGSSEENSEVDDKKLQKKTKKKKKKEEEEEEEEEKEDKVEEKTKKTELKENAAPSDKLTKKKEEKGAEKKDAGRKKLIALPEISNSEEEEEEEAEEEGEEEEGEEAEGEEEEDIEDEEEEEEEDGDIEEEEEEEEEEGDMEEEEGEEEEVSNESDLEEKRISKPNQKKKNENNKEDNISSDDDILTEDIYGRLRDRHGNIVTQNKPNTSSGNQPDGARYVPPALRKLSALNQSAEKRQQLAAVKRSLKGLINRLAESNMGGIASEIEGMYAKHARNDVNDMLTALLMEAVVGPTLTPERLTQELALLVALLSANVGNEIGAHILNEFVLRWHDGVDNLDRDSEEGAGCKELDNLTLFVCHLYAFRVVEARLIYDILHRLAQGFSEKEVELILQVLRSIGFNLRKDDPLALKALITLIQTKAADVREKTTKESEERKKIGGRSTDGDEGTEYSRVTFMLETIQAVRNNNVSKLPNYDPTHMDHLRQVLRGLVKKGRQPSALNVSLEDMVKARECGRWWVVGSAWSGGLIDEAPRSEKSVDGRKEKSAELDAKYSDAFMRKATKLQLSRPPRVNILYILTEGSEDYLDAFEKLLHLSLPQQQEREIFSVILLCCQKGKVFNPFFSYLADRMCKFDKKFVRLIQFALFDKFEELEDMKVREVGNIAKFVTHLIAETSLSLTVFKNVNFMDADKRMISLIRQVVISLLLHPAGTETVERTFSVLSASPKLKVLRQSLRIFILKFIKGKKNSEDTNSAMLGRRVETAVEILSSGGGVRL